VIQGKYYLPPPDSPGCLLAKHEQGLISEARELLCTIGKQHRGEEFNQLLLPQCRSVVEAIGHRIAYEAAIKARIRPALVELYECHIIGLDAGWYIENALVTRSQLQSREAAAATQAMEDLGQILSELGCKDYAIAPIVSDQAWSDFVEQLPIFRPSVSPLIIQERSRL
jgi:acyl-CoA oxidase